MLKQAKLNSRRTGPKVKLRVEVPHNWNDAACLDKENKSQLLKQALDAELTQLNYCETFENNGRGGNIPDGYKKTRVNLCLMSNIIPEEKSRFVAGGHLKEVTKDSIYSCVAPHRATRSFLHLSHGKS